MDGFYLMKNTTIHQQQNLTFCVPDCRKANPAYTNNPLTGKCESKPFLTNRLKYVLGCGDGCTAWSIKYGWEVWPGADPNILTSFECKQFYHDMLKILSMHIHYY